MMEQFSDLLALPGRFLGYLLEPPHFLCFLGGLFLVSVLIMVISELRQAGQLKARDAQIARYRDELVRVEKELQITKEMHAGLKGQYTELEQKLDRDPGPGER